MRHRRWIVAVPAALLVMLAAVAARAETTYPDLRGQWTAVGGSVKYVADKPRGLGQEAPLTPEYQAIFEANLRDHGGRRAGHRPDHLVPFARDAARHQRLRRKIEFVVTPETTHVLVFHVLDSRRIFTDGREFIRPTWRRPSSAISIGRWIDTDGDGRSTCWRWRRATSRARAPSTPAGLPLACGQSDHRQGAIIRSTRTSRTSSATRSPSSTTR